MTKVIRLASISAGTRVHSSAQPPTPITAKTDGLARQQAIENALSMALYHVRNGDTTHAIRTATQVRHHFADFLIATAPQVNDFKHLQRFQG